jgi:hypothetical protein
VMMGFWGLKWAVGSPKHVIGGRKRVDEGGWGSKQVFGGQKHVAGVIGGSKCVFGARKRVVGRV